MHLLQHQAVILILHRVRVHLHPGEAYQEVTVVVLPQENLHHMEVSKSDVIHYQHREKFMHTKMLL